MYQGFPGDYDSGSRCSSSPSAESQYLSSVDSFGSPAAAAAAQECSALGDMPGSFVPTVTAITSSQDLQWLVQPTLISSVAQTQPPQQPPQAGGPMAHPPPQPPPPPPPPQPPTGPGSSVDPYDLPGPSYSSTGIGGFPTVPPSRATRARARRSRDETLTPEEEEKRRVRRERNKLAAAKCRNRRRELTDRLQAETDQLEEEKAELESEIAELQKEKERLEFVLVAHAPACKLPYEEPPPMGAGSVEVSTINKEESTGPVNFPFQPGTQAPYPSCCFTPGIPPIPPNPSYTSSFVFTYPEGTTCGASHQRSSSSDQSSDSLNSPSLLAL